MDTTLVEPGGTRTSFNRNLAVAEPIAAYQSGILGQIRGMLADDVDPDVVRAATPGDPAKIAAAIADSVEISPAARRIVLGGNAHEQITSALRRQIADLQAQRDLAYRTDADDISSAQPAIAQK
jgi:hypothetical protein